jgi:hypothetical protein
MLEYYRAFRRLSTRRPSSFGGISPIPLSEIRAYLAIFETDDEATFVDVVCAADSILMKRIVEREKAKAEAKSKAGTKPNG